MIFVEVKALGGSNFIRADMVVAVSQNDPRKCSIVVQGGGNSIPCAEPARDVIDRLEAALRGDRAVAGAPT